tara:strand:- start:490 stop:1758 length:1269 start_codon:yes stop_codon:yes gene_type:complete
MANPTDPFTKDNSDLTGDGFYKKFNYKLSIAQGSRGLGGPVLTNFLYAEKFLYGRVDRFYVPMQVVRSARLKSLSTNPGAAAPAPMVLGFVADAFEELQLQFQKSVLAGKISAEESYLTAPKAHKGYEDPKILYKKHFDSVISGMRANFTKNNKHFKDFDEFIPLFMDALKAVTTKYPYTYPGYIKHRLCPISVSGLAIEIASGLSFADDDSKINNFIKSRNWQFYLNACQAYGFLVDQNAPWRLVADIGSVTMLKYSRPHGMPSTDTILDMAYGPAHLEYFNGFKRALLESYSKTKVTSYLEREYCQGGETIGKVVVPLNYSEESLSAKYDEIYFLDLYLKIRMMEEESFFTESEQERLINDTKQLYRMHDIDRALAAFERIIGKTYDYSGSLTNADKGVKLRMEEQLREQELRGAVSTYR